MIFHCFPKMADLIAILWLMLLPLYSTIDFWQMLCQLTMGYQY